VASARVWWTFKYFGHKNLYVLDGGLPKWQMLSLPTQGASVPIPPKPTEYKATPDPKVLKNFNQMKENLDSKEYIVVDARPAERFYGRTNEPRPGLKCGHIPGSKNVPWVSVLDLSNHTYLTDDEIKTVFKNQGVDLSNKEVKIITTCGSGVTAAVLSLALHLIGIESSVYDGSFSEWGNPDSNAPVIQ